MKILWLGHRDVRHPRAGGAEKTAYEVGSRLVSRGHEVIQMSSRFPGSKSHEIIDGIQVLREGGPVSIHLCSGVIIRHENPDVVIDDLAHVIPWFSPQFTEHPVVAFFRHLHARTLLGQVPAPAVPIMKSVEHLYPVVYRNCRFVTESFSSEDDLVGLGIRRGQVSRIPPGVDSVRFHLGERTENPTIVYFAGFRPYKRPEHALLALRRLTIDWPNIEGVFVGDGPTLESVKHFATKLGLNRRTHFVGRIDEDGLARIVRAAWVNVHCSASEGWGYSIFEASASGVPTVAYRCPGVSEAISQGKSGFLVTDGDVDALAEGIGKALREYRELTPRCREQALSFRWSDCTSRWERTLEGHSNGS
jgi:glycosyltransferase involved in cell wall biosynthesis